MIYKFKSQATGDVIMLQPNGDQVLRLLGREPAAKGIIEPSAMAAAVVALKAAVAEDETQGKPAGGDDAREAETAGKGVSLRARLWPMVEMLQRAAAAGEPIVWGV